jgi:hypothetical protein
MNETNELNEMTELEKQLGLWTPRHPSARLERRLFAAGAAPVEALLPFRVTWLAPVTAALMLMCVLFNQRYGPALSAATNPGPMVAMILSNQSAAAYLPGSFQAEHNNLPADTFKWTGVSRVPRSIPAPSRSKGNSPR